MASSTGSAPTSLNVVIPAGLKRKAASPETEVAEALQNSGSISKLSIAAIPNKQDKKRMLNNCHALASWLEQHGSQLTEVVLCMDEAQEVQLVQSLFKCPNLQLTRLLVSAADFPESLLLKLPTTLEVFSGHLGANGKLAPFVALPNLKSLAVRCYPTNRYDGHYTTAGIPPALLQHQSLQCLIIDASYSVYITDESVSPKVPVSKLKLLAITGDLSQEDIRKFIVSAPELQHLCLRSSTLSQMDPDRQQTSMSLNLGKLADLRALELGFPQLQTKFLGLEQLHKLSAALLCGQFGARPPLLPKALAEAGEEPSPEIAFGSIIAKTATVAGTKKLFQINECHRMQHKTLILEPKWVLKLSDSII